MRPREKKSEIAGREHDRQEITRSGAASPPDFTLYYLANGARTGSIGIKGAIKTRSNTILPF